VTGKPFDPYGDLEPYDPDAILADPGAHPVHVMYALINIGIRDRGEAWAKCAFCGEPYMLTEEWSDATVCSPAHHAAFGASIEEELAAAPDLFDFPGLDELGRPGANELRHPGPGDADGDGWDP
jgi:hypothetical protein